MFIVLANINWGTCALLTSLYYVVYHASWQMGAQKFIIMLPRGQYTCTPSYGQEIIPLQWCHNGRDGVSNHQPHVCLLNCIFRRRSKKASKFRATGLCEGNSPVTGEIPAQRASNAENVSICWRHHATLRCNDLNGNVIAQNQQIHL